MTPVLVVFSPAADARRYVDEVGLSWRVLVDERRTLYRAYGMKDASFLQLWGPATAWGYLKAFARGQRPRRPGSDLAQRGGDVLIDPEGKVALHHVGVGPADRPDPAGVLALVEARR